MKHIFFFLILCSFGYGQGLLVEDFKLEEGEYLLSKDLSLENGEGNTVKVPSLISMSENSFKNLGNDNLGKVNMMIEFANSSVKKSMKNKYTYTPRKLSMIFMADRNQFIVRIEYTAQNDYGALKDGSSMVMFDENSQYVDIFNL